MSTNFQLFVFQKDIPYNTSKGVVYITPKGEDYVKFFRSINQYEDVVGEITETSKTKNVFIDRDMFSSVVSFRVNLPDLPRQSRFIKTDEHVKSILDKLNKDEKFEEYDIMSGDKHPYTLGRESLIDINKYLKTFSEVLLSFLDAGYHDLQNTKKVPDWMLTFEEPIIKYMTHYFDIKTACEDIQFPDQFLSTPQFREMITGVMMRVMANYFINNEYIDINNISSWKDIKMWKSLLTRI